MADEKQQGAIVTEATKTTAEWNAGDATPHIYRAFGMRIRSDIPLPELSLAEADGAIDLSIELAPTGRPLPTRDQGIVFDFSPSDHYMVWPEVGAFRLEGTHRLVVEPAPEATTGYLAFPILGPIFGLLLHLRGLLVLHASAVRIGDSAAIFVGDKMAGKSTTAAAFVRAGYPLLTDDLLAIDLSDPERPLILPAFAQIKLASDSAAAVSIEGAEALPLAHPVISKRQHRLSGDFSHEAVAPGRLLVLDRGGDAVAQHLLTGVDALKAVMRFSYIVRFGKAALPGRTEAEHMARCAQLSKAVPIARLSLPADLERLPETVSAIEADLLG